jgi:hypothetical protein
MLTVNVMKANSTLTVKVMKANSMLTESHEG